MGLNFNVIIEKVDSEKDPENGQYLTAQIAELPGLTAEGKTHEELLNDSEIYMNPPTWNPVEKWQTIVRIPIEKIILYPFSLLTDTIAKK